MEEKEEKPKGLFIEVVGNKLPEGKIWKSVPAGKPLPEPTGFVTFPGVPQTAGEDNPSVLEDAPKQVLTEEKKVWKSFPRDKQLTSGETVFMSVPAGKPLPEGKKNVTFPTIPKEAGKDNSSLPEDTPEQIVTEDE